MHHFADFFNKVPRDFPELNKKNSRALLGVSRASKIFQGFPGFPGPVQTLTRALNAFSDFATKLNELRQHVQCLLS